MEYFDINFGKDDIKSNTNEIKSNYYYLIFKIIIKKKGKKGFLS